MNAILSIKRSVVVQNAAHSILSWLSLFRQSSGFVLFFPTQTLPFSSSEHSLTG